MAVVQYLKRVGKYFIPAPHKSDDGRDQWPSRLAYLLATMGGVAGQGNLIRYPSVAYNNYGLQWFIPYLMAVLFIATPTMILETAIGQAYRGGTVIAFNNINRRLRGVGFGSVFISFIVVQYFTVIVAWIMHYFRTSFTSPLPWEGRIQEFYADDVIANPPAIPGSLTDGNRQVAAYTQYPSVGMVAETVGWAAFLWFLVWISIFRGVTVTGRVAYFGMGLPIVTTIIMVGRSLSLENAGQGVRLLWGTWRGDQLRTGALWQTAVGQVFFSTGVGFGYFTTYASYNNTKHTNTVLDAILICASNVLFENVAALAIFGLIGYLRLWPQDGVRLGAFVVGFLTLPEAVLQMPGSNFWAILLFLTLAVLGFTSSFVMLDVAVTLVTDTGVRLHRTWVVTALTMTCFLMCLPYCTQFGLALLDGVDWWISNVALIFVVWAELVSATTVYRWTDVVSQTGLPAFVVYNIAYFGAQLAGLCVAHGIQNPSAGAGVGFGIYVLGAVAAVILSRAPDSSARGFWSRNTYLSRFWYLAFYSGNQLRRDLNLFIAGGKSWSIPAFLPFLLRYISAPILAMVFSFSYPQFHTMRYDPMMIVGFILSQIGMVLILVGFIAPRFYEAFIPVHRRSDGTQETVVHEPMHYMTAQAVSDTDVARDELGGELADSGVIEIVSLKDATVATK